MRFHTAIGVVMVTSLALPAAPATAQTSPLEQMEVPFHVDSGLVVNSTANRVAAYSTVVRVPDATWLRLQFDQVVLGESPGEPTVLRLTARADGAVQHHTTVTLGQWGNTSAYFNGDAVELEIIADPQAEPSLVLMSHVLAGPPGAGGNDGGIASICGPTDDRMPSSDPRACRAAPVGCTAWMISDFSNCFISAGHCAGGLSVMQFNVPLSNSNGSWNLPGPEDQYAVDATSLQAVNGGIGNDWAYFGCFPNTETGLTAFEAQGMAFDLAASPPPVGGQTIRITGYGTDSSPNEWNQIQQTHTGPYVTFSGTQLQYAVDTTGGNSGSPVINDDTGEAIGVHTHAGCGQGGGANNGTGSNNSGLQSALANPEGVCLPAPGLGFDFPDGIPMLLDPDGDSIRVEVSGINGGDAESGTGMLHYSTGGAFIEIPMQVVSPNVYDAVFPAIDCGTLVAFYFSAETTDAEVITNPLLAPDQTYNAVAAASQTVVFADDFETQQGWGSVGINGLTDGRWERGTPIANSICDRGNPGADADGSGQCYLTDNDSTSCNSDVDDGATILTSPTLDATLGTPLISYWRWFHNSFADNPYQDTMVVEVSDDFGVNWVELETVGPTGPQADGGWYHKSFRIEDFVSLTDGFRVRFIVEDADPGSVVEAAVDGVQLLALGCQTNPPGDVDGDGIVGILDFLAVLGNWGPCPEPCPPSCAADLDDDCQVGIFEFLLVLGNWD